MLLALGIAAAGTFATWSALTSPSPCGMGFVSRGVAAVAAHGARALGALIIAGTDRASAEETLQFKPVPAESVSRLESRRSRSTSDDTEPESSDESDTPDEPKHIRTEFTGKSGNMMRIGSDVHVEKDRVISGDLVVVGGDITVDGHVEGDVVALGGDIQLGANSRVDGDVACIGGQLSEDPGAFVGGQRVTAMGARGLSHVRGMRHLDGLRDHTERDVMRGVAAMGRVVSSLIWLFILVAVAWGYSQIAPGTTQASLDTLKLETAVSLLVGAMVWALLIPSIVALALVVAILCITIIGIPLGLAALVGYFVFLAVLWTWGFTVAAAGVGEWISNRRNPGTTGLVMGPPAWSLTRKAVMGVLVLSGTGTIGQLLQTFVFFPPLHGIGTFISVISIVAGGLAATIGGGAWLRTQIVSGTLGRWWRGRGRQAAPAQGPLAPAPAAPAAGIGVAPAGVSVPPPPPPPPLQSPPEAFAPPTDPTPS
jgi:hypothetical protein